MLNLIHDFYIKSHPVTIGVLIFLSLYFIIVNWVFFYRYFSLKSWVKKESESLESLLLGSNRVNDSSYLSYFIKTSTTLNENLFELCKLSATKQATTGLSILSIISSTSPFIGLFGTVVSILDTFAHIGKTNGGMSIISSGVADALVATAAGILVAIFAYTYHQILKRKSYELVNIIDMQARSLLSKKE